MENPNALSMQPPAQPSGIDVSNPLDESGAQRAASVPDKKNLPARKFYTAGEEILNVITHAFGTLFGVFIIVFGTVRSLLVGNALGIPGAIAFGACMMVTYGISSVYHALPPRLLAKRVLRVIDHCTVYLLIMGTYTALMLACVYQYSPATAIVLLVLEWAVGALAITLTAANMKKFRAFSMVCYIALGWCVIAVPHIIIGAIGVGGFMWLLFGGVAYTVGSVLYGVGRKKRYVHGVFHFFCLMGSAFQFVCFAAFCL
ncbi:MAG: hemolysin III family protein [Firmicutes bacterium]|nr:hemolysin III family protein [Bacillota bacterium]